MSDAAVMPPAATGTFDLRPYVSDWALHWLDRNPDERHVAVEGTLVFTDLSGFTALSERLAALGRRGSEEMADHLDDVFSALLSDARLLGGSLLHYGGDALALLFTDDDHERRAVLAAARMRATLRRVGRRTTPFGPVQLRMSTGVSTGVVDVFLSTGHARTLLVGGEVASEVLALEKEAASGEVLLGPSLAAFLAPSCLGAAKEPGILLARSPRSARAVPPLPETGRDPRVLVPASLCEDLLRGGAAPEHRTAAIGFVSFGGLNAAIANGSAASRVDALLSRADRICLEHGVALLAPDLWPDGGKLLIASGAPTSHEDNEDRLLHALRALRDEDPGGWNLRAGVNRGGVFAAGVGTYDRKTYTVLGDVVNTAARIMAHARFGEVLASEDVLARSRTLFDVTPEPPFAAKGKSEPLRTVVVGEPVGTRVVDADSALLGRDAEMARLQSSLDRAVAGAGEVVVLEAGPGVGKSRLLFEAISAVPREVRTLKVDCAAYRAGEPYAAAAPLLAQALQLDDDSLDTRVREVAPHLLPWLPLIALPLGLEVADTDEVRRLDPSAVVDRMHQVIAELLESLFPGPVLLVVDDAQWADAASVALLTTVMTRGRKPWTAWIARRPSDVARVPGHVVQLGALSDEVALQVVRQHAPFPMLPDHARAIVERADGNPLFLRELARSARAGEIGELPADLDAVFAGRIDALAAHDRDLLRICAVLGMRFSIDLPPQLSPMAGSLTVWDRLKEFLTIEGDHLQFRHAVARQVAYAGLPFSRRKALHGQIGTLLAAEADPSPELLSLHFTEAQEWAAAWRWSVEAGEQAGRIYALIEATRFYERAVTAGRHAGVDPNEIRDIQWRLAKAARHGGLTELAQRTWRDLARSGAPAEIARALTRLSLLYSDVGDQRAANRLARRALRATRALEGRAREKSDAWGALAHIAWRDGRPEQVIEFAERSLDECPDNEYALRAEGLSILAFALNHLDGDGTDQLLEAIRLFELAGDLRQAGNARGNLGVFQWMAGDWTAAEAAWTRSLHEQEQAGYAIGVGYTAVNLGDLATDRGIDAAADALIDRAEDVAVATRDRALTDLVALNRIGLRLRQLRLEDARSILQTIHPKQADLATTLMLRRVELSLFTHRPHDALRDIDELPTGFAGRARLAAIAYSQLGSTDRGASDLAEVANDTTRTAHERGCAFEALARVTGDESARVTGFALLRDLGIVQITTIPVRADEQPARVTI